MSGTTTLKQIGGDGGDAFSFIGENGASLEKIGVWLGESQVRAVRVWLSDGRVEEFGRQGGPYQEFKFQPGECFSSLSLWGNQEETRLGAIRFRTSLGREFFAKMTGWGLENEYEINVGSGYCLGVVGRSGWEIDKMGFTFINAVESTVLTNVTYPTFNPLISQVRVEDIKCVTFRNKTSINQIQKVETSKKVIKSSSWSMSKNLTSAFSMVVKAGIPTILEGSKTGYSVSIGSESIYSQEHTDERTETLTTDLEVPPGKKVDVSIIIGRASFDLPYTGTVIMTCENGSVFAYGTKGRYKGVTYTDIKVDTKESPL